jgi:hypothetical protein
MLTGEFCFRIDAIQNDFRSGGVSDYKLSFAGPAKPIGLISFADAPSRPPQGPRYTSFQKLISAKKLTDLFV